MKAGWVVAALALAACAQTSVVQNAPEAVTPVAIAAPSGEYTLDPTHSSVVLRISHFGLSNYTVRLTDLHAILQFDAERPTDSSVVARAASDSVETGAPSMNDQLEGADWLDAAQYPEITLRSRAIELTSPNSGRLTGDLTLHGVTQPIALDVQFNAGYARHPFGRPVSQLGFSARGTIKRSDFGMTTFLPEPIGVGDDIEMMIEAEFVRAAAPA